jgi:hypothetical protein
VPITVRIKGSAAESVQGQLRAIQVNGAEAAKQRILTELREATPKLTGHASWNWEATPVDSTGSFRIFNNVSYVKALNAGSSRQAPRNFVEAVVLSFGSPRGNIVNYR